MKRFIVILLVLCFIFFAGCGITNTEKTTFEGVDPNGNVFIVFYKVYFNRAIFKNIKTDVVLYPKCLNTDWIDIKIDPKLTGTLISIYPSCAERLLFSSMYIKAKKVIIWVPNKEDKLIWTAWSKKVTREYIEYQTNKNKKSKITRIVPRIQAR